VKRAATAVFALAAAAFAQTTISRNRSGGGSMSPSGAYSATAHLDAAPAVIPLPVTGQPYSGEEVVEAQQTLSDGTSLTHTTIQAKVYRDGQGRTRVEQPILRPNPNGPPRGAPQKDVQVDPIVEITDPVAGVEYILDVQQRVAHRSAVRVPAPVTATRRPWVMQSLPPDAVTPVPPAPDGLPSTPPIIVPPVPPLAFGSPISSQSASLGTQTIDGVTVQGLRTMRTIPAGAQGYDRDVVTTIETWTSPELRIVMLRTTTDPRYGVSTFRIQNFVRGEQDMSLFLPPADYTIKDDDGPFSITYSKP